MSIADRTEEFPAAVTTGPEEDLRALRGLLEREDVEGARRLVKEVAARWPESDTVAHWARVLAPPEIINPPRDARLPTREEMAWLRANAADYANQWLGLLGDQLVVASPDPEHVKHVLAALPNGGDALIHYQPDMTGRQ